MKRYNRIDEKDRREIVLLKSRGCQYKQCKHCDYYMDGSSDNNENFKTNKEVLDKVTGLHGKLEVINSGSFTDLDFRTLNYVREVASKNSIKEVIFECSIQDCVQYTKRHVPVNQLTHLRFGYKELGIKVKFKIGLESFNNHIREHVLNKGFTKYLETSKSTIGGQLVELGFNQVNLMIGVPHQTIDTVIKDISLGLHYFDRICLNIMVSNEKMKSNDKVISFFRCYVYPLIQDNPRIDILLNNTDFGVGGEDNE